MDFVCGAFVCAVVCASPAPRRRATRTSPLQGTCHHPTTTSAAGEPARRRRRAPQEPPLLRAPKSLRAPPSWAHFSVAFSQAGDLGFPIFTKPTPQLANRPETRGNRQIDFRSIFIFSTVVSSSRPHDGIVARMAAARGWAWSSALITSPAWRRGTTRARCSLRPTSCCSPAPCPPSNSAR